MNLSPEKRLQQYCETFSNDPGPLLRELERESHLRTVSPQMIAGPWLGMFLRMISLMMKPEHILEIGSFTGYSAICLSAGLQKNGTFHLIEANPEHEAMIMEYLDKGSLSGRAKLHIGNAESLVPDLKEQFDLVFIDAGKRDNIAHFELVLPKVRTGGFILIDNTLWSGKVLDPDQDPDTKAVHQFNASLYKDPRVEQCILQIRDGLSVIRKL
jgi:predicted O-methyltransferase YrrM